MKKITFFFAVLFTAIGFSQNQSSGAVQSSIFNPIPQQFGGTEIFRFQPGLVTQLDSGTAFDFNSSQWFSLGRLNTGSQTVYGLRFQLKNRAITMGYQDLGDVNPRIQWIGDSFAAGTDLEFRVSNSFTSTSSKLVATMTDRGNTFFGNPLGITTTKVGIDYGDLGSTRTGITVDNLSGTNAYIAKGIFAKNNQGGYAKTGIEVQAITGSCYGNTGMSMRISDGYYNTGITASVTGSDTGSTYGISGAISGPSGVTPTGFGAAIQGRASTNPNRYAGYFNGNVVVTGSFSAGSDRKLKENIKNEENVLEKLAQIDAVTYNFKSNDQLSLPSNLQHGFIAQNIEEVFPELVSTIKKPIFDKENKETGTYEYKAVNYIGMISILTSSLKELDEKSKAEMQELKEETSVIIAQLNDKVAALESKIQALTGETKPDSLDDVNDIGFSMEQNKPNPFTNQTVINYTLPSNTKATISVVDLSGKFIREYTLSSEKGQLTINSSEIGKGIFVYALLSDNEVILTKKMVIR
ncbi:putative secreted protein (Por secretion system target) [Kordia periserrulae]|uniref:Putative secreted protein (Por secretion system target) n=1 Tax=Kordia periserrulae TaxID=701523 RepID=A0A2T6C626_9FLAO|nr:tail fiber domain-containing protein [Kordia periserrulae]PTX63736.1 putative secreted protein (Por secretion system target) [Kordia periserrulae]